MWEWQLDEINEVRHQGERLYIAVWINGDDAATFEFKLKTKDEVIIHVVVVVVVVVVMEETEDEVDIGH